MRLQRFLRRHLELPLALEEANTSVLVGLVAVFVGLLGEWQKIIIDIGNYYLILLSKANITPCGSVRGPCGWCLQFYFPAVASAAPRRVPGPSSPDAVIIIYIGNYYLPA